MTKYKIIRLFFKRPEDTKVIKKGVTRKEAEEHCEREDTHGHNWFDTFTKE